MSQPNAGQQASGSDDSLHATTEADNSQQPSSSANVVGALPSTPPRQAEPLSTRTGRFLSFLAGSLGE